MSTTAQDPAERFYNNCMALRAGRISVEDARAVNRALRVEVGDAEYERAKIAAIACDVRRNG